MEPTTKPFHQASPKVIQSPVTLVTTAMETETVAIMATEMEIAAITGTETETATETEITKSKH